MAVFLCVIAFVTSVSNLVSASVILSISAGVCNSLFNSFILVWNAKNICLISSKFGFLFKSSSCNFLISLLNSKIILLFEVNSLILSLILFVRSSISSLTSFSTDTNAELAVLNLSCASWTTASSSVRFVFIVLAVSNLSFDVSNSICAKSFLCKDSISLVSNSLSLILSSFISFMACSTSGLFVFAAAKASFRFLSCKASICWLSILNCSSKMILPLAPCFNCLVFFLMHAIRLSFPFWKFNKWAYKASREAEQFSGLISQCFVIVSTNSLWKPLCLTIFLINDWIRFL